MPSARTRIELYYSARFESEPRGVAYVPGRLVVLGEHLDHQGGEVLATTLGQGVYVAYGIRPDRRVVLHALNARETDTFDVDTPQRSGRRWADLVRGAFARLGAEGQRLPGLNLAVLGDLPAGAGLASSAAYVAAIFRAVAAITGGEEDTGRLVRLVAAVEREWGGVACGLMDPTVVLVGRPGVVVRLETRTLAHEALPIPNGLVFEPVSTRITRRLDRTPYTERQRELAAALARLRAARPGLERLTDLTGEDRPWLEDVLGGAALRRARHVVTEQARVHGGVEALRRGDGAALGALLLESHASLRDDFECSTPAIDAQVQALSGEDDVLGARIQGAGWGGSIVVLRRRP
jgi:galactokinase